MGMDRVLAGRDAECAALRRALAAAPGRRPRVILVSGEGGAAVRAALDLALAASLTDTAADLQQRLADSLEHSGDYRAATAVYAAAFQFCDTHGADAVAQLCRACATVVLFTRGEWDRAAAVCQDVLASPAQAHARGAAAGMLGLVHAMRGAAGPAGRHPASRAPSRACRPRPPGHEVPPGTRARPGTRPRRGPTRPG